MSDLQARKGGKNLSTSVHRKERYALYKSHVWARNKLKRIIQSCGLVFAEKWAKSHSALVMLDRMK